MTPWQEKDGAEALLDVLAGLVAAHGATRLLLAPLIEETPRFFPDAWEPTIVGVGRVVHRLLCYAGLEAWEQELVDARRPLDADGASRRRPLLDFVAVEDNRLVFQLEDVGIGEWVPAVTCFEVARAFVAARLPGHPYRTGRQGGAAWSEAARVQAAVATIYLGFGLVAVNATHAASQQGEILGNQAVTWRTQMFLGALPGADLAFLLAVQLALRGLSVDKAAPLLRQLGPSQAEETRRWLGSLAGAGDALRRRLGVTSTAAAPADLPPVAPLSARALAALEAAEERHQNPLRGSAVVRYWQQKTVAYLMIGMLIVLVPALIALLTRGGWPIGAALLALGAGVGAVLGSRRRLFYCGGCSMLLRTGEDVCPKCAARFGEDVPLKSRAARLMAEAEEDEELAREALAAAPADEGDEDGEDGDDGPVPAQR